MKNPLKIACQLAIAGFVFLTFTSGCFAAIVITGVTASGSPNFGDRSPLQTVNGSGLDFEPTDIVAAGATHNNVADAMYLGDNFPNPATDYYLTYDLGAAYEISYIRVWNYNEDADTNRAIQTATLSFSLDAPPANDSPGLALSLNNNGGSTARYTGQLLDYSLTPISARYLTISVDSTYGSTTYAGLSEIRFQGSPIPEPSVIAMMFVGLGFMCYRLKPRRRTADLG